MPTQAEAREIIQATQATLANLAVLSADDLLAIWDALDSLNEAQVAIFLETALPLAEGTARTAASIQAASVGQLADQPPMSVAADTVAESLPERLRQPFTATWKALANGTPWEEASAVGRSAMEAAGRDVAYGSARQSMQLIDVPTLGETWRPSSRYQQRPTRHQRANWDRPAWKTWRRVLTPASCSWCQFFSTLRYYTAESATFGHQRCDCYVVQETSATGEAIDSLNQEVRDRAGYDERKVTADLKAYKRRKNARAA